MSKIMLVEDDTILSEIYRARLEAEGYEIVSAHDGEEALALAVKEKPDLIICDVMMPKISGFEMLDILRGTQGIQNTKVIMMSALSQAEDKARASALGADRYLVKSQVTLEDVVTTITDVLAQTSPTTPAAPAAPAAPATTPAPAPTNPPQVQPMAPQPVAVTPIPVAEPPAVNSDQPAAPAPAAPAVATPEPTIPTEPLVATQTTADEQHTMSEQIEKFVEQSSGPSTTEEPAAPVAPPAPSAAPAPAAPAVATPTATQDNVNISGKKVIEPLRDIHATPDINTLLAKEAAKENEHVAPGSGSNNPPILPTATSSYLTTPAAQAGQVNPNNDSGVDDPTSIAL